jgi:hypothetical protein
MSYNESVQIRLSKHLTQEKLPLLKKHGFELTEAVVIDTISQPDHLDEVTDHPRKIASKTLSETIVLRVVYKQERDIITAITVYPARKGRYY